VEKMMIDPRVAELEFLAFLDGQGTPVTVSHDTNERFGISADRLDDMIIGLIADNCALGTDLSTGPTYVDASRVPMDPQSYFWEKSANTLARVASRRCPYTLRITHAGRLRLSRLRGELDRGRISDQTGILVDGRHIDRDLRVRFAMAGSGVPVSVMMADLDHFKKVNDTLGHARGDDAIRRYLSVLRDIVSNYGGDAYRKGGDETIAILSNSDEARARTIAENVRQAIETEFLGFDEKLENPPTASIGVATFTTAVACPVALQRVDALLYRAKEEGGNWVVTETFGTT
jgi:diguanylate cyclase (GGDEF)-like protein